MHRSMVRGNRILSKNNTKTALALDCAGAAFLTIKDYLYPHYEEPYPQYSYASEPEQVETTVNYNSDTEFFQLANGMEYDKVWKIIAELMETLQVINPRLYAGVIKKLKA